MKYQPFRYPPDYKLAVIHQESTKPGKINPQTSIKCICCNQGTKQPIKDWFNRVIDHDFKNFGGAVVTYFWLIKLYGFVCFAVLLLYSTYLLTTIHRACQLSINDKRYECQRFIGIWIVTNRNLFHVVDEILKNPQTKARILTLRTIAFAILVIGNTMALYISGRFKRRYPQSKNISHFSLIFKNVTISVDALKEKLGNDCNGIDIKQMVVINRLQPYYTLYNKKLQTYYLCKTEILEKKRNVLFRELQIIVQKCQKCESSFKQKSDRVIVVFQSERQKNIIKLKYQLNTTNKIKYMLGFTGWSLYCQQCPIPSQIIWHNLGENQKQKIQLKLMSIGYFCLLVAGSYLFLAVCMELVYRGKFLPLVYRMIIGNIIMTLTVILALTFRFLMNKLSQMRKPNTQTSRTLFIVLTTILFHFIYYVMVPLLYLYLSQKQFEQKNHNDETMSNFHPNQVLFIITNQTFNFLMVQFILAGSDFIYRLWKRNLVNVMNQVRPIGCQKILHKQIQYPRFPIQFKLIILFKVFSFIILEAFETPSILFIGFVFLIFLYFVDKYAIYRHYRMQIIDNGVQYIFLKVYSLFFSIYTSLIYGVTQQFEDENLTQFYAGLFLAIILVFIQLFIIKDSILKDQTIIQTNLKQTDIKDSYHQIYNKYQNDITNDQIDNQIKQYLERNGHQQSIQTQSSINKDRLLT